MASGLALLTYDCAAVARRLRSGKNGRRVPGPPVLACRRSDLSENFTSRANDQNKNRNGVENKHYFALARFLLRSLATRSLIDWACIAISTAMQQL